MAKVCKVCAHYTASSNWCNEWRRKMHPNTIHCAEFRHAVMGPESQDEFKPMFTVQITPSSIGSESQEERAVQTTRKRRGPSIPHEDVERVVALVRKGNMSQSQIARELQVTRNRVAYLIARARKEGLLEPPDEAKPAETSQATTAPANNGTEEMRETPADLDDVLRRIEDLAARLNRFESLIAEELGEVRRELAEHMHLANGRAVMVTPLSEEM